MGGVDIHASTVRDSPLHLAILAKQKGMLQLLLEKGANVNVRDFDGKSALHYAVVSDQKDAIKLLLERHADIDARDSAGHSALYYATKNRLVDLRILLLQNGAKIQKSELPGISIPKTLPHCILLLQRRVT